MYVSAGFTPTAFTRTSTCPRSGRGSDTSSSRSTSAGPNSFTRIALILPSWPGLSSGFRNHLRLLDELTLAAKRRHPTRFRPDSYIPPAHSLKTGELSCARAQIEASPAFRRALHGQPLRLEAAKGRWLSRGWKVEALRLHQAARTGWRGVMSLAE